MNYLIYLFLFIIGSAIGSFLNVLICRLENGKNFISDRSHCPHCKKQIRWHDNIPILSFLILRGKCRDCYGKISLQYPLVEIATGALFVAIYVLTESRITNQESWLKCFSSGFFLDSCFLILASLLYLFIIFSGLFAILVYDFKYYIIPNKILYPLIIFVFGVGILNSFFILDSSFLILDSWESWQSFLLSLTAPLFFLSLIIISRGQWMGMGDVKLAFLMSLILGWPNILVALISSFWLGALASSPLIFTGRKSLKSQIPFGPFLIAGTFLAYFFGQNILDWYILVSF